MLKKIVHSKTLFAILSLLCTVGIFSYLFSVVSPGEVIQAIKGVDYRFLIAFIILSIAGSLFRALRYQLTLLPAGYSPSLLVLFLITLVRNVFSDLLPARIGTTVYIYLATSRLGLPVHLATSSFALSFLFDILALGPLMVGVLWFSAASLPFSRSAVTLAACALFLISVVIIIYLPVFLKVTKRVVAFLPFLSFSIKKKLIGFCEQLNSELILARHSGIYLPLFILSIFVRLCKYGSLYCFLLGIVLPLGITFEQANPLVSTIGILSAELAASLPISGIAGFGAYEGAWALSFSILGFPEDLATLTAISHHLFTQAYGYGLGAIALIALLIPFSSKEDISEHLFKGRMYYIAKQGVLFISVCLLVFASLSLPSFAEKKEFKADTVDERTAKQITDTLSSLPGTIIFDSNRSGTFGIYRLRKTDGKVIKLIDTEFQEMFPAPSPDGKKIAYARLRSTSRLAPSEIWMIDRNGKNPERVIKKGTFPSFSADGNILYYQEGDSKVMAYDFTNKETKEIFPRKKRAFRGRKIIKPRVSEDGTQLAFTADNPARWNAWRSPIGKGKPTRIGNGCEPTWFPDGKSLAWVRRSDTLAGSGIMKADFESNVSTKLQDSGPPLGHEYFPTVDASGQYLLYSACPHDQHDHISAAYQIHVKDLNKETYQQLTFDSATNRWAKLLPDVVD